MNEILLSPLVERLIDLALEEDIGTGDVTTRALIPPDLKAEAHIRAKETLVVAGLPVAARIFQRLDPQLTFKPEVAEGQEVPPGTVLAFLSGAAAPILTGERVALNFLMRLSGIATFTRRLAGRLSASAAVLKDTRKTTPGWRSLEKYAVRLGGGHNHRLGLFDAVLIKNNHLSAVGSLTEAMHRAREAIPSTMTVEVEVADLAGLEEALAAGAHTIMLDNMDEATMARAVQITGGRAELEASGGMSEARLAQVAATGVNCISMGALTHSAPAVDLHLRLVRTWR
jgi:nicotinate-nucleotide pyrophosphorylase (carboxylating)